MLSAYDGALKSHVATKVTFKDRIIGTVAKTVVLVDPAPTTGIGKNIKHLLQNDYRCPNCGHEWTE